MTPFVIEYKRRLDKQGLKLSPQAEIMAVLIGEWFQGRDNALQSFREKFRKMEKDEA